ncbi:MAG TPA: DUF721 domain-containing protein [Flavobacterium sp.]|nr:DUF721 domain-containing protein [Flavobacterium sp.]
MKPKKFNPYKRAHEEVHLSDVIQNIMKGYRLDKKINALDIANSWKEVLGPGVANYTTAVHFKNNVLYVNLSSAVLREELSYGKQKIIQLINEHIKEELVKDLILR